MYVDVDIKNSIKAWETTATENLIQAERAMGESILIVARNLAPWLTGALHDDGRVEQRGIETHVVFGGSEVPYALRRHYENKKNPQTLRYLERAGKEVSKRGLQSYL